ncbi:glutathione S-transferase N-terminal domain-containing protein [Rickettsiella grylli]|uniref:Stringent starvation protein A n=1 Tax=Rickettsiella grylli TaxID=59196 RepID=A8PPK1_9COXI|nr:glutathione S-transferase N-terminal domain-containing protein [Rickettsiella grylli]EDP46048.1 stringent starvation protein A [Rickettsiella grylli]OJA00846.1 stringent starvation protein A [Rickettsiella grylli]
MAQPAGKRSTMCLYANINDPYSHRVRIVLAEKGINAEMIEVPSTELPESLLQHNPYGTIPTIIDRDLVLYETNIITEYLDERFPHPPLLPVYPVSRAKSRQMIYRIERDWYPLLQQIESALNTSQSIKPAETLQDAKKKLENSLASLAPLFAGKSFFLSDEFTLVDCCMAPLLWRLNRLNIKLSPMPSAIKDYEERLFERPSFIATLNEVEFGVKT